MNGKTNSEWAKGKMRMLVVDDEPNICDCIRLILSMEGHEVVTANSGLAALSLFEKDKFDLVFTDYSMPGMKGDQLAAAIRVIAPNQPIMMITGLAPATPPAGVDLILNKPFQLEDLREAVTRVPARRV
jgi:CheY-like chemotaxis protein